LRILLDACVPRRLVRVLDGHEVTSATEKEWVDLDDGPLLAKMADRFDVLITLDKSIPLQQVVARCAFGIIILRARSSRLSDLLPLAFELQSALKVIGPGEVITVGRPAWG
jgi:predicted nuclease of predicted toxin-antitoxin system